MKGALFFNAQGVDLLLFPWIAYSVINPWTAARKGAVKICRAIVEEYARPGKVCSMRRSARFSKKGSPGRL
jgi:hypothetical protein